VLARRTHGSGKPPPRTEARPLRLLLFVASPEDLDPERSRLDFEREEELLFSALDRPLARGHVDIDVAEDGALKTLRTRLEEHRYHAVIFSMHGTEARNRQGKTEWGLLFEDARTGRRAPVAGSDLAEEIQTLPPGHRPGLVVLSACRSAQVEESTAKAIPSVASALHEGGCERVLGMRQSVLDQAASAFNAEFFRQLALGDDLGRSVGLARAQVAKGEWLGITKDLSAQPPPGDPFAQWTLPVLLDRTAGGPLVDVVAPAQPLPRPPSPSVLIGDGMIQPPGRGTFIGRRAVTRQYLRRFLEGNLPSLLFTGPGGVGKTALAGVFARRLYERYPHTRLMGFRAPFRIDETLFEALRQQAFDGEEEPSLQPAIQAEPNLRERLRRLLLSLAKRPARPCAFVLDNLEVLQDTCTLAFLPEHDDSRWFTETVLALPPPTRVLLTGRYALTDLHVAAQCPLPDAP
jgi:CHAT domain-containing protein/AAA ATPase-like protein